MCYFDKLYYFDEISIELVVEKPAVSGSITEAGSKIMTLKE